MERVEIEGRICHIAQEDGCDARCHTCSKPERAELLTEFDQLTAENERLSTKVATLQSHLDKISEPYHYSRDKAEYPWIRHEGKADGCPICRLKPLSGKLP